jgi:hypothetical protein
VSVLLDTSVVVDILRAYGPALDFARSLDDVPACSEITRVEVLRGLRSHERRTTERFLATLVWHEVDEAVARRAGEMGRAFRRSHSGVSVPDLVVAATAEEMGLPLATLNVRHFPMLGGLTPPYAY